MTDTNPTNPNESEIKGISRLLSKTAELAEQASLTGSLAQGVGSCIQQYNASVQRLEQLDAVPKGFFQPLAADSSFDSVGVASAQLAGYLGVEEEGSGAQGGHGIRSQYNIVHHNGADISSEELQELRELLRQHLPKPDQR